ncbi:hypothetical protein MSAN_01143700 [Mycena sanguinolenta]|uniref:Uncharacterized protein n=1 Tax=Mycena sanguinolenta TaxID=230812 RepID=A0A8H7D3S2_9AGAR|nr:hypothetical protein MSAN_01143700 [Mycena sanguinolenta]
MSTSTCSWGRHETHQPRQHLSSHAVPQVPARQSTALPLDSLATLRVHAPDSYLPPRSPTDLPHARTPASGGSSVALRGHAGARMTSRAANHSLVSKRTTPPRYLCSTGSHSRRARTAPTWRAEAELGQARSAHRVSCNSTLISSARTPITYQFDVSNVYDAKLSSASASASKSLTRINVAISGLPLT